MIDPAHLDLLRCPADVGPLSVTAHDQDGAESELTCGACGRVYPIRDEIPVLLVDEARQP